MNDKEKSFYRDKALKRINHIKVYPMSEEIKEVDENLLYNLLKPLIVSLEICGLAHERAIQTRDEKHSWKQKVLFGYGIFMQIITWLNVVRLLFLLINDKFVLDWLMIGKLELIIFNLHCSASATFLFYSFTRKSCLSDYLKLFKSKVQDVYPEIGDLEDTLKMKIIWAVSMCWILSLIFCLSSVYMLFFTHLYDLFLMPFQDTDPNILFIKSFLFMFITIPTVTAASFAQGFLVILCLKLGKVCEFITKRFLEKVSEDGKFRGKIDEYRQKHNDLCILIQHVDNFISLYISETLVLFIFLTCLVLYGLIYFPTARATPLVFMGSLWYLLCCLVYLTLVCCASAYVNVKAHELYDHLHGLSLQGEPGEHIAQVILNISYVP